MSKLPQAFAAASEGLAGKLGSSNIAAAAPHCSIRSGGSASPTIFRRRRGREKPAPEASRFDQAMRSKLRHPTAIGHNASSPRRRKARERCKGAFRPGRFAVCEKSAGRAQAAESEEQERQEGCDFVVTCKASSPQTSSARLQALPDIALTGRSRMRHMRRASHSSRINGSARPPPRRAPGRGPP